eukprot:TRINITY_DN15821_c0_g1_i1.p1 TRINITY_DN15821_c0_g1~~TRINITY_DN15821_c0_g1_i1.p1  ORF type:complete len:324 (+),score=79.27 TRINITY_DN15821_c0_g1_i1:277-1248(+)
MTSRTKRKRDSALSSVCEKLTGLNLEGDRGRNATSLSQSRSKSILKKSQSGTKVRFSRKSTLTDFVMFDEANIHEVQTCLHPRDGAVPKTPRSVVLLQESPEEVSDISSLSSPTQAAAAAAQQAAQARPAPAGFVPAETMQPCHAEESVDTPIDEDDAESDLRDYLSQDLPLHGSARLAKRGRIRQDEIEEGKRFREMLRFKQDHEDEASSPLLASRSRGLGMGTPLTPLARGVADSPADDASLRLGSPSSPVPAPGDVPCFGFDGFRVVSPPMAAVRCNLTMRASPSSHRTEGFSNSLASEGFVFDPPPTCKAVSFSVGNAG